MKKYHLYALIKECKPIYVGVTSDIVKRKNNHKSLGKDFDSVKIIKTYKDKKNALCAENSLIRFNGLFDIGLENAKHDNDKYFNLFKLSK